MFIELHDKYTKHPILVRVSAISTVTKKNKGEITGPTTVLTIGNERYDVVESYVEVFRMMTGYKEVIGNGGHSAE